MHTYKLQEAKQLNAKARSNMTSEGTSKVSLTAGTLNSGFSSSSSDAGLQVARELNNKSGSNKQFK